MCVFKQAEETAFRTYYSMLDREYFEAKRKELGLPHPCDDCDLKCGPRCRFYGDRK